MSQIVEIIRKPDDYLNNYNSRNYVILVLTVAIAPALIITILGYILSPNANKELSLITYHTEGAPSTQTSEPRTISVTRVPSFDFGTVEGIVIGLPGLRAIGASVIAEKEES